MQADDDTRGGSPTTAGAEQSRGAGLPADASGEDGAPNNIPERPPRGDVIEIPGQPVVEYEEVRSAPPWLTPLAISIVALVAVFVVARAAVLSDVEPIRLTQIANVQEPTTLVDGTPTPDVPEPVAARFEAPVVAGAELSEVPADIAEQCAEPFSAEQLDGPASERITDVVDDGAVEAVHIGPDALSVLRTGAADSPPDWPATWVLSCIGRLEEDGWAARPPRLNFARQGDRGASDAGPGVAARLTTVPVDATWAVYERDGWWQAVPVAGQQWAQLIVSGVRSNDPLRTVFLDDEGGVVADTVLERPTAPAVAAGDGRQGDTAVSDARVVDVGAVDDVLAEVEDGAVRRCADVLEVCVWLTLADSEVEALAAHGPHPLDVPPFGELGYCPAAGRLQGTVTRSQFLPDGSWRGGVAGRDADTFPVRFSSGRVLVDLGDRIVGEQATSDPRLAALCVFGDEPVGEVAEDQEEIAPL